MSWRDWTAAASTMNTWNRWRIQIEFGTPIISGVPLPNDVRKTQIKRARRVRVADKRADELLMSLLDDEQRLQYRRHGRLRLRAHGRIFQIGAQNEVWEVDESGAPERGWCYHPRIDFPRADRVAAMVLDLKATRRIFEEGNPIQVGQTARRRVPLLRA